MVKLRTNHGYSRGSTTVVRLIIIAGCLIALILYVLKKGTDSILSVDLSNTPVETRYFLPSGGLGHVVHYSKFSYSFRLENGHIEWVAFRIDSAIVDTLITTNTLEFIPDPEIQDFWIDVDPLIESGFIIENYLPSHFFLQTNDTSVYKSYITTMCPVYNEVHDGIWKELQHFLSQNVEREGELIVVAGPLFEKRKWFISGYEFPIPNQYFFAILFPVPGLERAIGFILPNSKNDRTLFDYAVSVDSLEVLTGLDFFSHFLEVEQEKLIEAKYDLSLWQHESD